jgi:cation diffusion facilitator CzcD-associated flavoprotein CzcO
MLTSNFIRFPPTWPTYIPAKKVVSILAGPSPVTHHLLLLRQIANWLEFYADALELNVWTSSTITSALPDASNTRWIVAIKRSDGTERVFRHVKHVVFATGLGGGAENINLPLYPGAVRTFHCINNGCIDRLPI